MPEFHAVQCFDCDTFQVQQAKKSKKFQCTVCGKKQSFRKVATILHCLYFLILKTQFSKKQSFGSSNKCKDVREIIMQLNLKREQRDINKEEIQTMKQEFCQKLQCFFFLRKFGIFFWFVFVFHRFLFEKGETVPFDTQKEWQNSEQLMQNSKWNDFIGKFPMNVFYISYYQTSMDLFCLHRAYKYERT